MRFIGPKRGVLNHDVRFAGFVCAFTKTVRSKEGYLCLWGEPLSRLEREVGCSEKKNGVERNEMVRGSIKLLKDAGSGLSKTLSEILVCPLSKQPLRSIAHLSIFYSSHFLYFVFCVVILVD